MYLKCEQCPFWGIVDINPELATERYDCTVSNIEDADMISDEMWCQHYEDKENVEVE